MRATGEMLEFPGNIFGLALNLERDSVGAVVVLGEYKSIREGDVVKTTGRISSKCRWVRSCSAAWSMHWATPIDGKVSDQRQGHRAHRARGARALSIARA